MVPDGGVLGGAAVEGPGAVDPGIVGVLAGGAAHAPIKVSNAPAYARERIG
jgi:hypothetical protein